MIRKKIRIYVKAKIAEVVTLIGISASSLAETDNHTIDVMNGMSNELAALSRKVASLQGASVRSCDHSACQKQIENLRDRVESLSVQVRQNKIDIAGLE